MNYDDAFEVAAVCHGHAGDVKAVTFDTCSPLADDDLLASASYDDTIKVWDLQTDFRKTTPNAVTLTQQFMKHGYHAVGIGKIFHNDLQDPLSWSEPKLNIADYPFDPDAVYRGKDNVAWIEKRKAELIAKNDMRRVDRFGKWYLKHVATENQDKPSIGREAISRKRHHS